MSCYWSGRFKFVSLSKLISGLNTIPIKIQGVLFVENNKLVPKLIWKCKALRIAKPVSEKKGARGLYYLRLPMEIIKTVWFRHNNKEANGTE